MALGAEPWRLAWLTLKRAMFQVAVGILLGVGCAFAWERAFKAEGTIRITAPANLIGAALALAAIALFACLVPVLRATRVNPIVVLRYE
jgi:ABC-type antimicrobial peptide transport system permease subunit